MTRDLIIIGGPTAVGKSAAAIELAKCIGGSIISADSMQVYRGMDIGTAKLKREDMGGIPHYLIDVLDPSEDFNIVRFKEMACRAMEDITSKGRIPIIAGGTGFYVRSVLYDTDFEETDERCGYREELYGLIKEKGPKYLHEMLRMVDPDAADRIHVNDLRRVVRALEYHHDTGRRISAHNDDNLEHTSPYRFCYFVLTDDRKAIYDRINKRVDEMIDEGLVDEVRHLLKKGLSKKNVSMHGLGYKEITDYLEGRCTLEEAVYRIKRDTRHFAKRQLTWYKRERDIIYVQSADRGKITEVMLDELKRKGIING